jgi:hypothetical protein
VRVPALQAIGRRLCASSSVHRPASDQALGTHWRAGELMKQANYPDGWNEARAKRVLAHYE